MTNTQSRVHLELTSRTISYAVMKIYFKNHAICVKLRP